MTISTSQISLFGHLDKSDAVLLGLLAMLESGKEICTARMVNLIYLLDEFSYQHDGVTLTGFDYIRSDDGPNVANDEVEKGLASLVRKGLVHCAQKSASPGSYKIDGQVNLAEIPLSADDWALIHSVIREYGGLSHADMVKAARRTMPMKNSVRYGKLRFQPNPKIETFKQSARKDADFMEECMTALADSLEGVAIEELRGAVVAEQTDP
jgi:hypothetical protein